MALILKVTKWLQEPQPSCHIPGENASAKEKGRVNHLARLTYISQSPPLPRVLLVRVDHKRHSSGRVAGWILEQQPFSGSHWLSLICPLTTDESAPFKETFQDPLPKTSTYF